MKFRFRSPKKLKIHKIKDMKKNREQLMQQFSSCPTSKKEYEIGGKKFTVVRHFTGNKNPDRMIAELAVNRADREMGL